MRKRRLGGQAIPCRTLPLCLAWFRNSSYPWEHSQFRRRTSQIHQVGRQESASLLKTTYSPTREESRVAGSQMLPPVFIVLFASCFKQKVTGKYVIPLVLTMMDVKKWARAGQRIHFKDRTCPLSVFGRQLASRGLSLRCTSERKPILTSLGNSDPCRSKQYRRHHCRDRANSEGTE